MGVKAAGAWGWQTHHLQVPNVMKIWEPKLPGPLWATPGLLRDRFTFYSTKSTQFTCRHFSKVKQFSTQGRTYRDWFSWTTTDCSEHVRLLHAVLQPAVTFKCNYANWYGKGWRQSGFLFPLLHVNCCWLTGVHGVFLKLGLTLGSSILTSASPPNIPREYRCYDLKP